MPSTPAAAVRSPASRRLATVAAALIALMEPALGRAASPSPAASKCSGLQLQTVGKKTDGLLGCLKKAVSKGAPVDLACLDKVRAKFDASWAKALAEGDCLAAISHDATEMAVDDFVDTIRLAIAPTFVSKLSGAAENPQANTSATGSASVTIDATFHTMMLNVAFTGLSAPNVAAHIHCCAPAGTNVIVATSLPTFPGFPSGVTAGTYSQTIDLTLPASYNPAFIIAHGGTVAAAEAALIDGMATNRAYLNIHTPTFPGGEIRGNF